MDFEKILEYAVKNKVSDIHISPGMPIFFRIHGELEKVGEKVTVAETRNLASHILTQKQQEILYSDLHIDFAYTSRSKARFRGNFYFTKDGLVLSLRTIPVDIPNFDTLGLPMNILDTIMRLKRGLVLVVGPTGHGKSTTLSSIIKHRSQQMAEHIITLEDPIEFLIQSDKSIVHQRSLGRDVSSFSSGLKAALREDPDVLLVGEMRDLETISSALTAAETGHLVFSTLHTNGAPETINRIIDSFSSDQQSQVRSQLATSLAMVLSQRLLPAKDGKGRVLCYEVMTTNYAIRNHIRKNTVFQIPNAMQTDNRREMVLFDQSLANLVLENKIDVQEAYNNAISQEQLRYILDLNGYEEDTSYLMEEEE